MEKCDPRERGAWNAKCALHLHTLWRETLLSVGAFTDTKNMHIHTHTHTCMHHDWGLWVTKVRMRRSHERKSENVRSVDIEHEPTTEGLACVGGDVKRPHVCAALSFDRSGASFLPHCSLRPAAEARSCFIIHTEIFISTWKIRLQPTPTS